jgi:hypothetical protein
MRNAWLRENLFVTHYNKYSKVSPWAWTHAPVVKTRLGRFRTSQVWYESRLCILCALPKLVSGVNSVDVNSIFHRTPQVKVCRIEVRWPWWPRHGSLEATTEPPSRISLPVQPDWNVLGQHRAKTTSTVVCTTKHSQTIEVRVYGEIAYTKDR